MAQKTRRRDPDLTPFGVSAADEKVYREVLRLSPATPAVIAEARGVPVSAVEAAVDRLAEAGLVGRVGDAVVAIPPERLLAALVDDGARRVQETFARLGALGGLLPSLLAEQRHAGPPSGEDVVVETIPFSEVVPLVRELTATSTGDLLWLRPDAWRVEVGREIDTRVKAVLAAGRPSRVIYPARVLEESPATVRARADVGEHVRVLASVPARMGVFGTSAAVIHEHWRAGSGRLLVIRHPAMVEMVTMLFDLLWERAVTVPGLEGAMLPAEREASRRLLLEELARGAKDEQIARALGLGLRTVRRRVAELMDELGVGSRFQAGVEAVRRGWI